MTHQQVIAELEAVRDDAMALRESVDILLDYAKRDFAEFGSPTNDSLYRHHYDRAANLLRSLHERRRILSL